MASLLSTATAEDTTEHSLPSFTTFTSDLDPSWDYPNTIHSTDIITSQANSNYTRPWEMESKEAVKGFEPFPKLPSFQSQFHVYNDPPLVPEPSLPQAVPVSPSTISSPLNGSLTQLTPIQSLAPLPPHTTGSSFHTLTTVQATPPPTRTYPLVPAPIQARDIPTIQQQYLDERHIQLYQPITTFAPAQNVVTVVQKNDHLHNGMHPQQQQYHHPPHLQHHAFQPAQPLIQHSPAPITMMETNVNGNNGTTQNFNGVSKGAKEAVNSPQNRKKERRKIRAASIESSADSEGSAMDLGDMSSGQVSAVSSTANFKSPMGNALGHNEGQDSETSEKGLKQKKRKRCGECMGCQRKDNCGDCAPCRNDKSHQICKQRRCEKLTDKKMIYGADGTLIRGESKRGRGKGRGAGTTRTSFRGRKSLKFAASAASPRTQAPAASVSPQPASVPQQSPNTNNTSSSGNLNGTTTTTVHVTMAGTNGTNLVNGNNNNTASPAMNGKSNGQMQQQHVVHQHQPQHIQATTTIHAIKDEGQQQQQPMAPMAFYPTWQAATDPSQGWQNQFIQHVPQNTTATATIAPLNTIEFQPQSYAYPAANGYVQTGIGFDPNYGRTYAAPTIQRYEFQPSNQINQVVSFAPTTVTYAGQVSTGPSPILLANGQQSLSMAGNDMPGYPRVSSVPPPSLSYNGYSGEVSGKSSNSNSTSTPERSANTPNGGHMSAMNPPPAPQLTQSPGRQQESTGAATQQSQFSPSHQQMHQHSPHHYGGQPQQPSPNPHLNNVANYAAATPSPSGVEWDWSNGGGNSGDMYNQQSNGAGGDRLNLNTRLKTMILSKNDGHNQSQGNQHHMSSVELSPPPSNGSAHGPSNGAGQNNSGHFAIIKNVC